MLDPNWTIWVSTHKVYALTYDAKNMNRNLISLGSDVLDLSFIEDAISFSMTGYTNLLKVFIEHDIFKGLTYSFIQSDHNLENGFFEHNEARWNVIKSENNHLVRNLYHMSPAQSALCVVVPDEALKEFCDMIDDAISYVHLAPLIDSMVIHQKMHKRAMPENMEQFFGTLDIFFGLSPTYASVINIGEGEGEGRTQFFNYPTIENILDLGESVPSLYGTECHWKTFGSSLENYTSFFPLWWEFNSSLLKKNRVEDTEDEDDKIYSELEESVSLNRTSIVELSWEIAQLRQKMASEDSL